jgi:methylenetetrahydrofolate dehydrogenase (NADP+) / methenyltetrahydrofolate cyclohydrolase
MIIDDKIIDGKALSDKIICTVRNEVTNLKTKPGLAAILIGDNPSSSLYIKLKKQACEKCAINFHSYLFESDKETKDVVETIKFLNADPDIDGVLVQLPLPEEYNTEEIITALDYRKDIDGFHPTNRANMQECSYRMLPPLPLAISEMVNATGEDIKDKQICILCNSKLFGDPFKCLWNQDNEVNIVSTEDADWKAKVLAADILIVSIGIAYFITKDMIKQGCLIIDVGINKLEDGEIVGDVNFADVLDKVKYISPVPGGVGPVTVAMLLKNLVNLHKLKTD